MHCCDGYDEYLKSMKRRCRHLDADEKVAEAKGLVGKIASAIGSLLKLCFNLLKKLAVVAVDTITFLPKEYIYFRCWLACREAQLLFFLLEKLTSGLTWLLEKMQLKGASDFMGRGRELFKGAKEFDKELAEHFGKRMKNARKPWTAITGTR